jgi:hypothetical protein
MAKRIYIYRSGATNNCALTAAKHDPRLPPPVASDRWCFWMQIGPHQAQNGHYGFDIRAAVQAITTDGYYLFTGSRALLRRRPLARPKVAFQARQDDA